MGKQGSQVGARNMPRHVCFRIVLSRNRHIVSAVPDAQDWRPAVEHAETTTQPHEVSGRLQDGLGRCRDV